MCPGPGVRTSPRSSPEAERAGWGLPEDIPSAMRTQRFFLASEHSAYCLVVCLVCKSQYLKINTYFCRSLGFVHQGSAALAFMARGRLPTGASAGARGRPTTRTL